MADATKWNYMELDSEYVPQMRRYALDQYEPKPPTKDDAGYTLAIRAPCARGKSSVFREYMKIVLAENPNARILLMSANIGYGTNLAHELQQEGFDVGFYRDYGAADKGAALSQHQVVVCSFESLHHIDGQRFDLMLIDEVRHISALPGGATTCYNFANLFLLRELWATTPRRVICDADLLYKVSDTEPCSAVQSLMAIIEHGPTLCAELTHPGPPHLKRSARFFYTYQKAPLNKKMWFGQIAAAAKAWHDTKGSAAPHRFAVCVGSSKKQLNEVCALLEQLRVRYKPYTGDTRKDSKADLKDPDTSWVPHGAIVATTTLSIGVDPKTIQFARVFIWTCHTGCPILGQFQEAQRFGRSPVAPLLNTTIDILLDTEPPDVRAKLVKEKKRPPTVLPTYEDALRRLTELRASRLRVEMRGYEMLGGTLDGVRAADPVCDKVLRLLAHRKLERDLQAVNVHSAVLRACEHHGWTIDHSPAHFDPSTIDTSALAALDTDEDDRFMTLTTPLEKWEALMGHVQQHGEEGFFADCYAMASLGVSETENVVNLGFDQMLVRAFWLLKHVQRLVEPKELALMASGGVLSGLELNALGRCITATEQVERDRGRSLDPSKNTPHPFLRVGKGMRMEAANDCAQLLGIESLFHEGSLPQFVLDVADRQRHKAANAEGDAAFIASVRCFAGTLHATNTGELKTVLANIAKACGMTLEAPSQKRSVGGLRRYYFTHMTLKRTLPEVVDDWLVLSTRLDGHVRVADWQEKHADLADEEQGMAMAAEQALYVDWADDDEEQPQQQPQQAPAVSMESIVAGMTCPHGARFEKIDGQELAAELKRLRALTRRNDRDQRWLNWLEKADQMALPRPKEGEPTPTVRYLVVTYSKRRSMGRRTASHPSMQHCPSGLRPLLVMHFYQDVDIASCHPTLMLQVALKMKVPAARLERLRQYVEGQRGAMLEDIATFYGVHAKLCKYGVLRVLNGGSWEAWVKDAECTQNADQPHPYLLELSDISKLVRDAFLRMPEFKDRIAALKEELRTCAAAKVAKAQAQRTAASTPEARRQADQTLSRACAKATAHAIERSVFSHCMFELEDAVLATIDTHFEENGWTVASLIFDGLHVEHRANGQLEQTMREAEARVLRELGYRIELVEKPLSARIYLDQLLASPADQLATEDEVQESLTNMARAMGETDDMPMDDDDEDDMED